MTSPFSTLFIALQNRIKDQVPEIRLIDQDLGQLMDEMRPPLAFPAVLIDFNSFAYADLGENIQTAEGLVSVKLLFSAYSTSSNITPEEWKEKALRFYDIEWAIYKALQGWQPEAEPNTPDWGYGHLLRTGAQTEVNQPGLRIRTLTFSVTFEDSEAQFQYETTKLKPPVFEDPSSLSPESPLHPRFKVRI